MCYRKVIFLSFFLFLSGCSQEALVLSGGAIFETMDLKKETGIIVSRGEMLTIQECLEKVCKVMIEKNNKKIIGFYPLNKLYLEKVEIASLAKDAKLKKKPDLLSEDIKKVEAGTKIFILEENLIWAFVDINEQRGWILKEAIFKGETPIKMETSSGNLKLELKGSYFIPFISGERYFSLEKAFDNQKDSFAIARLNEVITVTIKNPMPNQSFYKLSILTPSQIPYKNIALPEEIEILEPFEARFNTKEPIEMEFQGNILKIRVSKASKEWCYLNHFLISSIEK